MKPLVSPSYQMKLVQEVKEALFGQFQSYDNVRFYIEKWYEGDGYDSGNFNILYKGVGQIDVLRTLHTMDGSLLLKIAVDLGVATPDFIPTVATFKNELKSSYKTAYQTFEKALLEVEEHPDIAVGLVNSALESIIKEICKDELLAVHVNERDTLYTLCQHVLKALGIYPSTEIPTEIRNIGSGLLKVAQEIEKVRSSKTKVHAKVDGEYIVDDPLLAQFIVNSVATIGVFLINFYKTKFPPEASSGTVYEVVDELPF
jgi:hypothetical protein